MASTPPPPQDAEGGFLSRWSHRKVLVREGTALPVAPAPAMPAGAPSPAAMPAAPTAPAASAALLAPTPAVAIPAAPPAPPARPTPPLPTLADVAQLTPASDFTRFVAPGVDSSVKNAALKTLFTDPHFNLMDGLDTYIDDYGKPDPLPAGMLRQMAQSQFLGLFADEAAADDPAAHGISNPDLDPTADEDAAVRLQPHDAAGPRGPGPGAGPDAAGQC